MVSRQEQFFLKDPMQWWNPDSPEGRRRFSRYAWEQANLQAEECARLLSVHAAGIQDYSVGVLGFGFGRETTPIIDRLHANRDDFHITGVDINKTRFAMAGPQLGPGAIYVDPIAASINNAPFREGAFHATVCLETLVHVENLSDALDEMSRITKPEGLVVFNVGVNEGIQTQMKGAFVHGLARTADRVWERLHGGRANGNNRTTYHSRDEIAAILERLQAEHGMEIIEDKLYTLGMTNFLALQKPGRKV